MKTLLTLCLTIAVLLGSVGVSWSADYQKGLTAAKSGDFATALREWTPLAEQGNAVAQYNLGQMYRKGQGVSQDYKTAVKWYRLAAKQGDDSAQFLHGRGLIEGAGAFKDEIASQLRIDGMNKLVLSAKNGFPNVLPYLEEKARDYKRDSFQYSVGLIYRRGWGVAQNYGQAFKWFSLAAHHNQKGCSKYCGDAQNKLGMMYFCGKMSPQKNFNRPEGCTHPYFLSGGDNQLPLDFKAAYKYFQLAAKQSNKDAENNIGILYAEGLGVKKDPKIDIF
jgi:TPR repeat protein